MKSHNGAMVVVQHDVTDEKISEYFRLHSFEHLPERLALPGFRHAEGWGLIQGVGARFLCVIDVESLRDLESPEYLAALNSPTDWTRELMPHYGSVQRTLCETLADFGTGVAPFQLYMQFGLSGTGLEALTACRENMMTVVVN